MKPATVAELEVARRCYAHPMSRALLLLLSFAVLAHAQVSPGVPVTDFQDDDISLVLRTLARQGNFEIIIASKTTGTVTLRAENKTPREVFDLVVAAKNLVVNERDGILYVREPSLIEQLNKMVLTFFQ